MERHCYVPYGFNFEFKATAGSRADTEALKRLGITPDSQVVISVGALGLNHKRHEILVDEFSRAHLPPTVRLVLVGQSEDTVGDLESYARSKLGNRVLFVPDATPDEVRRLLSVAKVFVLCSLAEGFGRAAMEAVGEGLPVILHDSPPFRECFGAAADYVDTTQPGVLGSQISRYFSAEAASTIEARQAARNELVSRLSWPTIVSEYVTMLKTAASLEPLQTIREVRRIACRE